MTELQSALLLRRQLAELNKNPVEGFSAGLIDDNDLYRWEVLIIGPPDTLYEGVDKNGDVCISILHEPGEDKYGYEKPEERWLPIHTVETIMISVISMLADPNGDSPANVDAAGSPTEKHGTVSLHSTHLSLDFCRNKLADTGWKWAAIEHASISADTRA
ncbi:ubiquitin-conjugating enzyme E2 G1 isoform X2 [Prionailurus iriomotensis]